MSITENIKGLVLRQLWFHGVSTNRMVQRNLKKKRVERSFAKHNEI